MKKFDEAMRHPTQEQIDLRRATGCPVLAIEARMIACQMNDLKRLER